MAAPRKRSKRRRPPHQGQSVRARPQPPAGKPPAGPRPEDAAVRPPEAGIPAPGPPAEVGHPTLEEVDLAAGAPPENLGPPTSHPPDDLAIVTGELPAEADELDDDDDYTVAEPARAARPGRVGRGKADQLDAEDELLPAARQAKGRPPATVGGNKVTAFLRASWAELQRVQWPNRRQVGQATAVVLGFVVIAGGYLGLADLISQKIVDGIL